MASLFSQFFNLFCNAKKLYLKFKGNFTTVYLCLSHSPNWNAYLYGGRDIHFVWYKCAMIATVPSSISAFAKFVHSMGAVYFFFFSYSFGGKSDQFQIYSNNSWLRFVDSQIFFAIVTKRTASSCLWKPEPEAREWGAAIWWARGNQPRWKGQKKLELKLIRYAGSLEIDI